MYELCWMGTAMIHTLNSINHQTNVDKVLNWFKLFNVYLHTIWTD